MKKYIPTEEEIGLILKMYNDELIGSTTISEKTGISGSVIRRILREKGSKIGSPGRRYIGGKKTSEKKYREKNKIKLSKKHSEWSDKNKEKLKQYRKEWREKNVDRVRKNKREYEKTRKSNNPTYKLISNFRTAIYQVLKENNIIKNKHYFEVLNYSQQELISHLESKFKEGMSWDNYGKWHVDHIRPISSFNIKEIGDEEFMMCWGLNNLQPLWSHENLKKSNSQDWG